MIKKSQAKFIFYFGVTFIVTFILLYTAGFVPGVLKPKEGDSLRVLWDKAQKEMIDSQTKQGAIISESPTRIVIDKIGVDSSVSNPNTTNVKTLDSYLLEGAVRYPSSGLLGAGNMFIFAHSAEAYTIVNNPAYKAFNGLKLLKVGDIIKVSSATKTYEYRVATVSLVDKNKALVELDNTKNMLTLSTCNTLGTPSERYVVTADYVGAL